MHNEDLPTSSVNPPRKPELSLILCSRNDQYMGNPCWRLQTALNYLAQNVHELGREEDVEVIVADWGSEIPLHTVLQLSPIAARMVSFVVVPPALAQKLQKDSTFSLFEVMDYCLTVRGTVGIEAARLGIPVLTAGTGRYDHRGFTIDSESREQYLERVAHIQDIPRLSPAQRELAERFAYGTFVLRPLPLSTVTLEYRDEKTFLGCFTQQRLTFHCHPARG